MLKEDILFQQIVVLLNPAKKETNLLISTEAWTVFDLLQKLNISSTNDSSPTSVRSSVLGKVLNS